MQKKPLFIWAFVNVRMTQKGENDLSILQKRAFSFPSFFSPFSQNSESEAPFARAFMAVLLLTHDENESSKKRRKKEKRSFFRLRDALLKIMILSTLQKGLK